MSDEDELLQLLMSERDGEWRSEVHYNHYGDRGVLDAVHESPGAVNLYELKSASAVRNVTGANEILRQVNRHREYYFEDHPTRKDKRLYLIFTFNQTTWDHIKQNISLYTNLREQSIDSDVPCIVSLMRPDSRRVDVGHPTVGYQTDRWDEQLVYKGEHFFGGTGVDP